MFDLDAVLIILFFLVGISVGSFLNVVADRVPLKQSIVSPPSYCFNCGHALAWQDMVPVVSYIALRGKCRYCGAGFSPRSMIVEALTGLLFVAAWLRFGAALQLAIAIVLLTVFIVISITSIENRWMPLWFYAGSIVLALLLSTLQPVTKAGIPLLASLTGLAAGAVFMCLVWLAFKLAGKSIDKVNILITALVGASIGFPVVAPVLIVALLTGMAWLIISRLVMRQNAHVVPFPAILCCLALIVIFCGPFYLDTSCFFRL